MAKFHARPMIQPFSHGLKNGILVIWLWNKRLSAITFSRNVPSRNLLRLSNGCRPDKVSRSHHLRLTASPLPRVVPTSRKPKLYTAKWWMTSLAFQTSWTCSVGQLPFVRNTETSVLTTIVSASNLLTKTFCCGEDSFCPYHAESCDR